LKGVVMGIKKVSLILLLVLFAIALPGCKKQSEATVDTNKPVIEIKAELGKMSTEDVKDMAKAYADAIKEKNEEVKKALIKFKELPGEDPNAMKAEIDDLNKAVSALNERSKIYYDKLKELGVDMSDVRK